MIKLFNYKLRKRIYINLLQEQVEKEGKVPGKREFKYSFSIPIELFGTWNNFIKEAELKPNRERLYPNELTKEKCIELIRLKYKQLNRIPIMADFKKENGDPAAITLEKKYGFSNLIIAAIGKRNSNWNTSKYANTNDKELLSLLKNEIERMKQMGKNYKNKIDFSMNRNEGVPHPDTYCKRFGEKRWSNILELVENDFKIK